MKKDIVIVDLLLLVLFGFLVIFKIGNIAAIKLVQLPFMLLIAVHIIQHRRAMLAFLKQLKK